jgi:hypothetical protein
MKKDKRYTGKMVLSHTEEHETPKGRLGLIFCNPPVGGCNAVYYKKSWHRNLRNYKSLHENSPIKFSLCPACKMIQNKQFEGEITIKNIPFGIFNEIEHLIITFSRRAYERDPMDRLIAIKKNKSEMAITLTENQLAVKIAKKIKDTFKSASWRIDMKISYSPQPSDVAYVKLEFK